MATSNSLVRDNKKPKFSVAIQGEGYRNLINNTLGDPKVAQRFISSVTSAVSVNPALQDCDAATILSAAFLGESLNLSPSPQLGQYYMVPFKDNKNGRTVATFQLGYKGYVQLAIRSGEYRKLNVLPIKLGELVRYDPLLEEIEVHLIDDEVERENAETTGYYAMFESLTGYRKTMYWSKEKMEAHALKYSKGYAAKKGYTFWEKDFDGMACKTMLRQLISKWGMMSSVALQRAYEKDMTVTDDKGNSMYIENDDVIEGIGIIEQETEAKPEEPAEKPATRGKKEKAAPMEAEPEEESAEDIDNHFEESAEYAALDDDDDPLA